MGRKQRAPLEYRLHPAKCCLLAVEPNGAIDLGIFIFLKTYCFVLGI